MPRDFQAADAFSEDEEVLNESTRNVASTASGSNAGKSRNPRFRSLVQGYWRSQWAVRVCSMLCCVVVLSFIAMLVSVLYIVLKDLRAEKITTDDGAEVRILGFWSLLVLSSLAGVLCCSFTWTLTYFDSFEPGMFPPTPLSPAKFRQMTGHSFHLGYSMALLNGVVAALTVIWYLT